LAAAFPIVQTDGVSEVNVIGIVEGAADRLVLVALT
jgi:hypothetical protein